MALTVAELRVQLEAQTRQFNTRLTAAEQRLTRFGQRGAAATGMVSRGLGGIAAAAGPALAALGSFLTIRFFATASRDAALFLDTIGKVADQLDVTTGFLQEFRTAAELTGGSTQGADRALQRFVRSISEAQEGTGPTAEAFQELGIRIGALRELGVEQALERVADGLTTVESAADRNRIAFDLFGRSGGFLVNTLREGSEGLQAFRDRARESGQVVNDELIRRTEQLNDRLTLANMRLRNETLPVLIDFREGVVLASEFVGRLVDSLGDLSRGFDDEAPRRFSTESLAQVNNSLAQTEIALERVEQQIAEGGGLAAAGVGVEAATRALERQRRELTINLADLERRRDSLNRLRREEEGLADAVGETNDALGDRPDVPPIITREDVALSEDLAAIERNRIREAFFRQEQLNMLRDEALRDELAGIEARKRSAAELARQEQAAIAARRAAEMSLSQLIQTLRDEEAARIAPGAAADPLRAEAIRLQRQIEMVSAQVAVAEAPEAQRAGAEALAILNERRRRAVEEINRLESTNTQLAEQLEARGQRLLETDEARGQALLRQLEVIRNSNLSLEETRTKLLELVTDPPVPTGEETPFAESLGRSLAEGFRTGFADAEGDIFDGVLTSIETATSQAFKNAQDDIAATLAEAASDGLKGIGRLLGDIDIGGAGGIFGRLGTFLEGETGQAALNFGVQAVRSLRRETEVESRAAAQVASAVTSVQQVRGLVAGPQQIAIAQVERGIRDAFVETNVILRRIEGNTRQTAANSQPAGGGTVAPAAPGNEATTVLVGESESLL